MIKLFTVLVMILGLAACAKNTTGIGIEHYETGQGVQSQLKLDNSKLAGRLVLSEIKTRSVNGLIQAQASLKSTYSQDQTLQYKFYWYDKDGFEVERDKSPWRSLKLHGSQQVSLQGGAPNSEATGFKVYVREVFK